jgi:Putative adhesin
MLKIVAIVAGAALALVVAAAFVSSAFDVGPGHTRTETRAFAQPVRTLTLKTHAGDIELVRGERLVLRETHHYHGSQDPNVTHSLDGDALTVEDHGCTGHAFAFSGCSTDFRVELPPGIALRTTTDAGDVTATAIQSPALDAETNAGDVHATAFAATRVHAETDAGDVELELLRAPSLIQAQTDAGDVEVTVPRGSYAITTDTDAGEEDVTGLVNDPAAANRIDARTDAGDVTIRAR